MVRDKIAYAQLISVTKKFITRRIKRIILVMKRKEGKILISRKKKSSKTSTMREKN